ncbi:MAG: leucine-rich repeat protein [Treponemataceae bacterium]|nr:leucine-rich repeat protein [Treponemataceae bacterium]
MKKKWVVAALAVACALALAGCKIVTESEHIAVESVMLSETTLTLAPGATRKLTATVKPENADDKTVIWSSSDMAVATVGNDGTVTAVKEGSATITAKAGDKQAKCVVTVNSQAVVETNVAVDNVTLDTTTLTLALGGTRKLTATVTPSDADDKNVKWSSSDTAVATVGNDGTVTAIKEGNATITAQAGDKKAECVVTVKLQVIAVESITLDATTLTLEPGTTEKLTATVKPDNADNKTVIWSSSDTSVATVAGGTVTAVAEGTTIITAQADIKVATCIVTVKSQGGTTHVHYYSLGICTVCGFQKPFMLDGTIDDNGVLTNYRGAEATVVIPDGVIGIGSSAFENCGSLKKVVIPGSVTAIGSQAFKSCGNLNTVEMSTGLMGIGSYAFSECTSLKNVSIPDGVTSIGDSAFSGCSSLMSLTIPTSVTSFGENAFEKCESLATVRYSGTLAQWCAQVCDYNVMSYAKSVILTGENDLDLKAVTTLTIPQGVIRIENYAFLGCKNLVSVTIPTSVTKIRTYTFYWCENIATVRYNGTLVQWCAFDSGGDLGFYAKSVILAGENNLDLKAVTTLTIPDCLTGIGRHAFGGCTELTSVYIPNSIISIGDYAFHGCTGLMSVFIPNSVTTIGSGAFFGCEGLKSVIVPHGVTNIGLGAFTDCTGLTSVTIPSSVKRIESMVFFGCKNLTSFNYDGTKEEWNAITKSTNWDFATGKYTITCTDGTIAKQ